MKDNQVAVVTKFAAYAGLIVKRNGDALFSVGSNTYWAIIPDSDEFRVKVLPNGKELVIAKNE